MRRPIAVLVAVFACVPIAGAQSTADFAQTAAYAASLQNKDGGFGAAPGQASTLAATGTALRVLHYVGGSVPDVLGAVKYIKSCQVDGGFAATPGGKREPSMTAVGLLAAVELKLVDQPMIDAAIADLHEHATDFEPQRMAIAALYAVHAKSPDFPRWNQTFEALRQPDGGFGNGPDAAFKAGTYASTVLRTGTKIENPGAVVAAMKAGQQADGGWSKNGGPSDLPSSYRVMRALFMLDERPDADRLVDFIARCRNSDGSYATAPGAKDDRAGTYYAMVITYWLRRLGGEPTVVETAGFTPIFNGKDLSGWEGNPAVWSVRDGMLVGKSNGLDHNEFLAFKEPYKDFVLSLTFRLVDGKGNSGVQLRSLRVPGTEMSGYQADIGDGYWASLYDESRRNKTLVGGSPAALAKLNKNGWNHYMIRAFGDRITINLNGATAVDYKETDPTVARDGLIAVQVHGGPAMEVQFKDIQVQRAPSPDEGDPMAPGFHLRSVQTEKGPYRYTVYVPEGYDPSKSYPAILFLHGAGERGDDGRVPAQVGLGPAILQRPGGVQAIVVFPQARKTWQADSDDARAALKALEAAAADYRIDPNRIVVTGLSMGGMGSWSLAAKHPEKFAAVAPICGPGRLEDVAAFKSLPIRGYVGDADSDRLHLGMRKLIQTLRDAGAQPGYTEYRGVGHNSWDRAYNDHELIDWMLAQRRP